MEFYELDEYKSLEAELQKNIKQHVNFLIVTAPGYSLNYFLMKFMETSPNDVTYITQEGQTLDKYSILNFDYIADNEALQKTEKYMKSVDYTQKFAVTINSTQMFESEKFKTSHVASHVYSTYFFGRPSYTYVERFIREDMGINLKKDHIERIYDLSGGVARFVKYLALDEARFSMSAKELIKEANLRQMIEPIASILSHSSSDILDKLGVIENGKYTSLVLNEYFKENPPRKSFDIEVDKDLSFTEKEEKRERLTKVEADILKLMLDNDGVITKEKVADIKWGEGSYDNYSDQAVGKTMRRLGKKMKTYEIKALSNYGYKILIK